MLITQSSLFDNLSKSKMEGNNTFVFQGDNVVMQEKESKHVTKSNFFFENMEKEMEYLFNHFKKEN